MEKQGAENRFLILQCNKRLEINVTKSIIPLSYQMGKLHNSTPKGLNHHSSKIHFFVCLSNWNKRINAPKRLLSKFNLEKSVSKLHCKQINQVSVLFDRITQKRSGTGAGQRCDLSILFKSMHFEGIKQEKGDQIRTSSPTLSLWPLDFWLKFYNNTKRRGAVFPQYRIRLTFTRALCSIFCEKKIFDGLINQG